MTFKKSIIDVDGTWEVVNPDEVPQLPALHVQLGGGIAPVGDPTPLSSIPTERMYAYWDEIMEQIRAGEAGRRSPKLTVNPGGEIAVQQHGESTPLSTVPEERMYAVDRTDDSDDLAEIRRYDPSNVEMWTWVPHRAIPGWKFEMSPVGVRFAFFAFRSSLHGGHWLLSCWHPRYDADLGHDSHVVALYVASNEQVPIVCRSQSRLWSYSLSEVRGLASKFAIYHTAVDRGFPPPFSA